MTKRILVRGADVKALVDVLVEEARDDAAEHLYALDQLRAEVERLAHENRALRAMLEARAQHAPIDNA